MTPAYTDARLAIHCLHFGAYPSAKVYLTSK